MMNNEEGLVETQIKSFGLAAVLFGILGLICVIFQNDIASFGKIEESNITLASRIIGTIALITSIVGWIQKEPKRPIYVGFTLSILTLFWLYLLYAVGSIVVLFILVGVLLN